MAKYNVNYFKIEGTIFDKHSRQVKSKKDGKDYEFKSIILELKREYKGKTYIELPEFQLGFNVTDDGFDVGDYVQIAFSLSGKEVSSSFHKTELKALSIKHPDLETGNDTRDVGGDVFPNRKAKVNAPVKSTVPEEPDDLPF